MEQRKGGCKIEKRRGFVPPKLVQLKAESLGYEGKKWLRSLEDTIHYLERKWQVHIGKTLEGGSEALVTEASTEDGTAVILKLAMPSVDGNTVVEQEIEALTIADGDGYVRLLHCDLNHRAVLLERLGMPLMNMNYSIATQMEIICHALKKSWGKTLPHDHTLQSGHEVIDWFTSFLPNLWTELQRPCSKDLVDKALVFLESRLENSNFETSVLVHGDAHNGNVLQEITGAQLCFKLIDPDGLVAERAYDLGVLMREWSEDLRTNPLESGRKRCAFLSELTGVDAQAIWEWGFIQSVATGLLLIKTGQEECGVQMLEVAEVWKNA